MASTKKDGYYFPHICNSRNDRKIRKAMLQLGIEAYAIYFMTLEVLREQKDYKYPIADIDVLAYELDTSIQKVEVIINNYGLFEIDEERMFFSVALIRLMAPWDHLKKINGEKGKASALAREKKLEEQLRILSQVDSSQPQLNHGQTTVQQEEEKKGKEKKDIKKYSTTKIESFSKFVSLMRINYINSPIVNESIQIALDLTFTKGTKIRISKNERLYNTITQKDFTTEQADLIWHWLHNHQEQILPLESSK